MPTASRKTEGGKRMAGGLRWDFVLHPQSPDGGTQGANVHVSTPPVLPSEPGDALEFGHIRGDQDEIQSEGVSCQERVVGPDWVPYGFELGTDRGRASSRGGVEGEFVYCGNQGFDLASLPVGSSALLNATEEFEGSDGGSRAVLGRDLGQPIDDARHVTEDVDASAGIEKVPHGILVGA